MPETIKPIQTSEIFQTEQKRVQIGLLIILLCAFVLRLGAVLMNDMPKFGYSENGTIAQNIFQGKGYMVIETSTPFDLLCPLLRR